MSARKEMWRRHGLDASSGQAEEPGGPALLRLAMLASLWIVVFSGVHSELRRPSGCDSGEPVCKYPENTERNGFYRDRTEKRDVCRKDRAEDRKRAEFAIRPFWHSGRFSAARPRGVQGKRRLRQLPDSSLKRAG